MSFTSLCFPLGRFPLDWRLAWSVEEYRCVIPVVVQQMHRIRRAIVCHQGLESESCALVALEASNFKAAGPCQQEWHIKSIIIPVPAVGSMVSM